MLKNVFLKGVGFLLFGILTINFHSLKSSPIPSIKDTIHPEIWLTAGPFASGARESATDPLYEHGGFGEITPEKGMEHHSVLYNNGKVLWQKDTVDDEGILRIKYKDAEPEWSDWKDYKGRTFTRSSNYARTEFEAEEKSHALVIARGVGSFRLNGKTFSGDYYNDKYLNIPVILEKGTNNVLMGLGGSPSSSTYFALVPVEKDIKAITEDVTAPDLIREKKHKTMDLGLPLVNHMGKWKNNVKAEIFYLDPEGERNLLSKKEIPAIGPLAYRQTAHTLDLSSFSWENYSEQDSLPLEIEIKLSDTSYTFTSEMEIKEKDEPYDVTFRDSDNSVQFYSVFPPSDFDPENNYPAIFTLHGASVDASGSNGYTQKDWAYVIAPTNRRCYGFDWEKQGKINALNTLADAKQRFDLDESRIYLSGHSMGGHGTWVLGTAHPHLFAAIGPSAGWTSFDIYTPFVSRWEHLLGNPANLQMLNSVLQPTRTLSMVENLYHIPVYILQGGSDMSVPPDHARLFYKRLSQLDYKVTYNEVSGKEHWWKFEDTEGADCVNHKELMEFFRGKPKNNAPRHIWFKTAGLADSHQAYWISVLQRKNFTDDSHLKADVEKLDNGNVGHLETFNIKKLEINTGKAPFDPANTQCIINGNKRKLPDKKTVKINLGDTIPAPGEPSHDYAKSPGKAGPVKQVFYEPFALVFSTQGGKKWRKQTYEQARRLAQSWYYRGNGKTRIIPDTMVNDRIEKQYNLILLGSPATNSYYGKINEQLPVRIYEDSVVLGNRHREDLGFIQRITGKKPAVFGHKKVYQEDLSVKFIYPNPEHPERFVQINGGATLSSQAISMEPSMLSSASGLPDFLIFDELIRQKGFAALINAGFFDNNWLYNPEHAFEQPVNMRN